MLYPGKGPVFWMRPIRVFILSDSHFLGEALLRALRKEPDFQVVAVIQSHSTEALTQAVQSSCDVLLIDASTPQWNSQAVIDLRTSLPDMKIVLLNMNCNESSLREHPQSGIADYLLMDEVGTEDVKMAIRGAERSNAMNVSAVSDKTTHSHK